MMDPKENLIRAITRQDPAYVPYYGGSRSPACPIQSLHFFGATPFDYQRGRTRWTEELFGVEHEASEGLHGFPAVVGNPLKSLDDIERFAFPDPYVPDRFQRVREQIDTKTYLAGGAHRACLFSRAWSLLGMEGLMLEMAARCWEMTGLGYMGVDLVLDRDRGPLLLELNARPGLAIQLANRRGLKERLDRIDGAPGEIFATAESRVEWARRQFP